MRDVRAAGWRSMGLRAVEFFLACLAAFLAHRLKWSSLWISFFLPGGFRGFRSFRRGMNRHDGPGIPQGNKAVLSSQTNESG